MNWLAKYDMSKFQFNTSTEQQPDKRINLPFALPVIQGKKLKKKCCKKYKKGKRCGRCPKAWSNLIVPHLFVFFNTLRLENCLFVLAIIRNRLIYRIECTWLLNRFFFGLVQIRKVTESYLKDSDFFTPDKTISFTEICLFIIYIQ